MLYDLASLDGAEPDYAPGLAQVRDLFYWRAPPRYTRAGYKPKSVRLGGTYGDGQHLVRAAKCRDLTREMLRWYEGVEQRRMPGTWGELIGRYKSDDYSPIRDVKANTRKSYLEHLAYWEPAIGRLSAEASTYDEFRRTQKAMEAKGRSSHFIHAKFTMLRIVAGYGVACDPKRWTPVKAILGQLKLRTPKGREVYPTREQVMAVVAQADAAGERSFALGVLIQFFFALRARDVRGDYMAFDGERSGIIRGNVRWVDGLTWDMIDKDVTRIEKVASKTIRTNERPMVLDLTLVPDVRERLLSIGNRVGPVIVDRKGMPYRRDTWADLWRRFRRSAGLPEALWLMDLRAGAATEAEAMGASPRGVQTMLNHAQSQTTERYLRGRDAVRNSVIELRGKK